MYFPKRHNFFIFFLPLGLVFLFFLTANLFFEQLNSLSVKTLSPQIGKTENIKQLALEKKVLAASTSTFYPIADSFVWSYYGGNMDNNYGDDLAINVSYIPNNITASYLKFDLTPLAGKTISSASLQIHKICSSQDAPSNVRVKSVSDTTWGEYTITWNNKPPMGSQIGSFAIAFGEWSNVDILSYVDAKKGGLTSIGLDTDTDSDCLDSREQSYPPRIVVVYEDTPTPGSYTISGSLYRDANKNGLKDAGESNYSGTPSITASRGTVTVNSDGTYIISNLSAGTVTVSINSLPEGYSMTYPLNGPPPSFQVTVGPGCNTNGANGATCQ